MQTRGNYYCSSVLWVEKIFQCRYKNYNSARLCSLTLLHFSYLHYTPTINSQYFSQQYYYVPYIAHSLRWQSFANFLWFTFCLGKISGILPPSQNYRIHSSTAPNKYRIQCWNGRDPLFQSTNSHVVEYTSL